MAVAGLGGPERSVNAAKVFPTVLNCSCGDVTRSSKVVWWSFDSRVHSRRKSCVVGNCLGRPL